MMFENEADVYLHMERVHEYGEECALYPCEECGQRGQDKLSLNNHIRENHALIQSTILSDTTLEEFAIKPLPKYNRILMILSLMTKVISKLKNQMMIIQRMLKNYS